MTLVPHPPDSDPNTDPDQFVEGDQASSLEAFTERGREFLKSATYQPRTKLENGAHAPERQQDSESPDQPSPPIIPISPVGSTSAGLRAAPIAEPPGLIRYVTEPDCLERRYDAELKLFALRWGAWLVSALALLAVFYSADRTATAVLLITNVLSFVTGLIVRSRTKSPNT